MLLAHNKGCHCPIVEGVCFSLLLKSELLISSHALELATTIATECPSIGAG